MFKFLSIATGALSIVMLIKTSIETGSLLQPLNIVLEYYVHLVDILVKSWADPIAYYLLDLLDLHLPLHAHWQHVLVLMWLYFGSNARAAWQSGIRVSAVFKVVWGGCIALAASIGAGLAPDAFFALWPIIGLFVFELGDSIWSSIVRPPPGESTWKRLQYAFGQDLRILLIALLGFLVTFLLQMWLGSSRIWGLALLGVIAIGLALYWARRGYVRAVIQNRGTGDTVCRKFASDGASKIAIDIVSAFFGAFGFIMVSAGLGLVGL